MKKYYAREALLPRGWARDVTIAVRKGDIVEVKAGARDGGKLRLVAWRTRHAVYWVSNTLSLDLTNTEMLGIARSATRASSPSVLSR